MIVCTVARHESICYSYVAHITNDVKTIRVKKRERHVLMRALRGGGSALLARIQPQSPPISDSSQSDSGSNARV